MQKVSIMNTILQGIKEFNIQNKEDFNTWILKQQKNLTRWTKNTDDYLRYNQEVETRETFILRQKALKIISLKTKEINKIWKTITMLKGD